MDDTTRILLFAKAPRPGYAKTRLIPAVGEEGAAALQARLLARTLVRVMNAAIAPLQLWCSPHAAADGFGAARGKPQCSLFSQVEGDLGVRMQSAAQLALRQADRVILIGTDCPLLGPPQLLEARRALEQVPVVLGPAQDGGYYLLGLRDAPDWLFANMPWGTDQVLAITRERLRTHGLAWRELETLWDLDRPEDLQRLSADLVSELMPQGVHSSEI